MSQPYTVAFDPVAFKLGPLFGHGPLLVHWYGLMYLLGFVLAWACGEYRRRRGRLPVSAEALGDLAFYVMMGVIVGGRLGYMLFGYFKDGVGDGIRWIWTEPQALFKVWDGGMSFHGGLVGVLLAGWWWSRRHRMHMFDVVDFAAPLVPIGLGLGRLGNFINGELWGKPADVAWAMIFPGAHDADVGAAAGNAALQALYDRYGGLPRHPSQLYEMLLEGVVMFAVLWLASMKPRPRYFISGLFGLLYGCFRFAVEFVRVPDAQLGYRAFGWLTKGQELSVPLVIIGVALIVMSRRAPILPLAAPDEPAGPAAER